MFFLIHMKSFRQNNKRETCILTLLKVMYIIMNNIHSRNMTQLMFFNLKVFNIWHSRIKIQNGV